MVIIRNPDTNCGTDKASNVINLAEVEVYNTANQKLTISAASFSSLWGPHPASLCTNNVFTDMCHSGGCTNGYKGVQWLKLIFSEDGLNVGKVIITNRAESHRSRISGAWLSVYRYTDQDYLLWTKGISGSLASYTYNKPSVCEAGNSNACSICPTGTHNSGREGTCRSAIIGDHLFEQTSLNQNSFKYFSPGNFFGLWSIGDGHNVPFVDRSSAWGYPRPYPSATQAVSIQRVGKISQVTNLGSGYYTLSFSSVKRKNYDTNPVKVRVENAKNSAQIPVDYLYSPTLSWATYTQTFSVPTTGVYKLTFQGMRSRSDCATAVTNVKMVSTCAPGMYAASASSCASCPVGRYSAAPGAASCTYCPTNSYTSGTGNTARSSCSCNAGYSGNAATGSCTACVAGKYKTSSGNTACSTCSAGHYSASSASSCSTCPAGRYSASNASSCSTCPAGKYSGAGASSCATCAAGEYSLAQSDACTPCPVGKYSPKAFFSYSTDAVLTLNGSGDGVVNLSSIMNSVQGNKPRSFEFSMKT
eukprot:GSChrysophyteH1.ASY1.ANO1.3330.1 assembled CDS